MSRAPYPHPPLRMSPDIPKICCNRCSHSDMTPTQTQFLERMGTRLGFSILQWDPYSVQHYSTKPIRTATAHYWLLIPSTRSHSSQGSLLAPTARHPRTTHQITAGGDGL